MTQERFTGLGLLPIEVLTREEIEKIVEDKLKKLLSDMRIQEKIAEQVLNFETN